jgi:hypothetical protein
MKDWQKFGMLLFFAIVIYARTQFKDPPKIEPGETIRPDVDKVPDYLTYNRAQIPRDMPMPSNIAAGWNVPDRYM